MEAAALANEFIDAFNDAGLGALRGDLSADVVYEEKGSNRTVKGLDGVLEAAKGWRAAFPDVRGKIFETTAAGNTAALEITWMGTHNGPLELPTGTLPATGQDRGVRRRAGVRCRGRQGDPHAALSRPADHALPVGARSPGRTHTAP